MPEAVRRALDQATSLIHDPADRNREKIFSAERSASIDQWSEHLKAFGLARLSPEAIDCVADLVRSTGKGIVSIFAGLGYAEEQLAQRGLDVVAYDKSVFPGRWFKELQQGDVDSVSMHGDRLLFMGFPDRDDSPRKALENFRSAGGNIAIVVSPREGLNHLYSYSRSLHEALESCRLEKEVAMTAWPSISVLQFMRSTASLQPVLRVYDVRRNG